MPDAARLYTPAEAGAVSGLKLKAVHNAIDKRIVEPVAHPRPLRPATARRPAPRYPMPGETIKTPKTDRATSRQEVKT